LRDSRSLRGQSRPCPIIYRKYQTISTRVYSASASFYFQKQLDIYDTIVASHDILVSGSLTTELIVDRSSTLIRVSRGKNLLVYAKLRSLQVEPLLTCGLRTLGPRPLGLFLWRIGRWNDVVRASTLRTIDPDPAKNCVNNTSKTLQKLKCFKSSETRPNMPITRLEMVGFTFRFKVKHHRNGAERTGAPRRVARRETRVGRRGDESFLNRSVSPSPHLPIPHSPLPPFPPFSLSPCLPFSRPPSLAFPAEQVYIVCRSIYT
jgi:hypothetical protein